MNRALIASLLLAAGCFDSLVGSPCDQGYQYTGGHCVERGGPDSGDGPDGPNVHPPDGGGSNMLPDGGSTEGGPDSGPIVVVDADPGPDALVCTLPTMICHGTCIDMSADPDNCGACERVCASGICTAGHCSGTSSGHIVAIGHDYQAHHPSMRRVLSNAISLGYHFDVGVARWRGTATNAAHNGTTDAITKAMVTIARPWHSVAIPATPRPTAFENADVVVVESQSGDGDASQISAGPWAAAFDHFLQHGGVVIVMHGNGSVTHRFAEGASLYTIAAPVDATNVPAMVVDSTDAVAQLVVSPYLAETSSVVFPGVTSPVVSTVMGDTVVFHQTRY